MSTGLSSWFTLWHRRYRTTLTGLIVAGTIASILVYFENDLLELLTESLASSNATEHGFAALIGQLAIWLKVGLPLVALGLFVLYRLASDLIEFWQAQLEGHLGIRSRADLETEILLHLLRKEDSFFSRHSPAEMVNRLTVDVSRVSDRRRALMKALANSLLLAGNLVFFFVKDWRLVAVAVVACLAGVAWTLLTTKPVAETDEDYLVQDDTVKSRFEDLLRTAPEVQVTNFYDRIRGAFLNTLEERNKTFLKYVRLNSVLRVGNTIAYLAAFTAMILVVLEIKGGGPASLALVPVIVLRLPTFFVKASELVFLRVEFQIARASMDRLLEYETQEPASETAGKPENGEVPEPLTLENAGYRYVSPDGTLQGGISEVSTVFAPGRWIAVVGGAGSGKSTLLQLLLGRVKAQEGEVLYGSTPLDALGDNRRAALLSVMPQSSALLNATLRENLLFGQNDRDGVSVSDLEVIEGAGLGKICRLKALDMAASDGATPAVAQRIGELRNNVRARLRQNCQAAVLPFEEGNIDAQHWVLESLLGGRCDRTRCLDLLLGNNSGRKLQFLTQDGAGQTLTELGRSLLRENRHLLSIPNYHAFAQLSAFSVSEALWKLRSSSLALADKAALSAAERLSLSLIGLTSSLAEVASDERAEALRRPEARNQFASQADLLRQVLAGAWRPFLASEVHPNLTWRENLIFGVVDVANKRASRMLDQTLLGFIEESGLNDWLTRVGLEFQIGRLGGNLSGGPCQLVALCRTLLRRTPVLVLDEPTSALDPASRCAVAAVLRQWKHDRIVITVSHDLDFVREADEIKLIHGGRLIASGTFQELQEGSEIFRSTLQQA